MADQRMTGRIVQQIFLITCPRLGFDSTSKEFSLS
jgi:hypothetical protein